MDTDDTEDEHAARRHDDLFVDLELIIREIEWVSHEKDEGNFDPKLVGVAQQEESPKFEKLKVYEIVNEEGSNAIHRQSRLESSGLGRTRAQRPNP